PAASRPVCCSRSPVHPRTQRRRARERVGFAHPAEGPGNRRCRRPRVSVLTILPRTVTAIILAIVAPGAAASTQGQPSASAQRPAVIDDLVVGAGVPARNKSTALEPCAAKSGDTVMVVGNWFATVSSAGGSMFLDPFSFFPPAGTGFCCDQSVVYD